MDPVHKFRLKSIDLLSGAGASVFLSSGRLCKHPHRVLFSESEADLSRESTSIELRVCIATNESSNLAVAFTHKLERRRPSGKGYPCATARDRLSFGAGDAIPKCKAQSLASERCTYVYTYVCAGAPCRLPCRLPFVGVAKPRERTANDYFPIRSRFDPLIFPARPTFGDERTYDMYAANSRWARMQLPA